MNQSEALSAVLREPEFSHGEVLEILPEITAATLMSWFKRDLVPLPKQGKPGRGNRRKYSVHDLLTLYLMKLVIPYVGQSQSALVAHDCTWILVKHYWAKMLRGNRETFPQAYLVLSRREADFAVDLVTAAALDQFMTETSASGSLASPEARVMINARDVLVRLLTRITDAKKRREADAI